MSSPIDRERWQRLSALFDELAELDAAARATRLHAIRAEDAELAAELEAMLEADADTGVLDHEPALPPADAAAATGPDRRGQRLGPWRLVAPAGRGGMGEVWLAERVDGDFHQRVALKLLHAGMDSAALLARFARERRILGQLEHPNIARLLDGGRAEDGTPWLAMEYVEGRGLIEHADAAGLGVRERVALVRQVAEAVAHAQSRLVVHRDLKPSNLMVDVHGQVRVLDFGIAKLLDETGNEQLTGTGIGVLSPAYAAPEQVRGEPVTTATDVYALGGVLFELLTGRPPHPDRGSTPAAWLRAIDREATARPSLASAATTTGGRSSRELRGDLDTIIATAMHADPARRYASAAELAADLGRWLDGRPVAARADTAGYRMRRFVARHRLAVGSASGVLLALVAGLGVALWQAGVARDQARRADAEAERARVEAARADAEATRALDQAARAEKIKAFLSSIFVQVDPLRRDTAGERTLAQAFDEAVARIDVEFADDPETRIDLLDDFGEIRAGQGDLEGAQALIGRALELAEATHGPKHPAVAESLLNLGVLASYRGTPEEGVAPLRRAVAILEPLEDSEGAKLTAALSGLAGVLHARGCTAETVSLMARVLEMRRIHEPDNLRAIAIDLQNLATALACNGRVPEAEPLIAEAAGLIERLHGPESLGMVPVLWLQEDVDFFRGDLEAEAATIRRAAAISRRHIERDHWWKATSLTRLGYLLSREGDRDGALATLDEALGIFERLGSSQQGDALLRRGEVHVRYGDWTAARADFARGREICIGANEATANTCLMLRAKLAVAMARDGEGEAALAEAERVDADSIERFGEAHEMRGHALQARAAALQALGRLDEARQVHEQREALLRAHFGPAHPVVLRAEGESPG